MCHPDRPYCANGLCKKCYCKQRYQDLRKSGRTQARKPAICHPDKPSKGLGLCGSCYSKQLYKKKRAAGTDPYSKNPEKARMTRRRNSLKKLYGITLEEWQRMFDSQEGKCAICGFRVASETDHCHRTGKVRGLLCSSCNLSIGALEESIVTLESAIKYLKRNEEAYEKAA